MQPLRLWSKSVPSLANNYYPLEKQCLLCSRALPDTEHVIMRESRVCVGGASYCKLSVSSPPSHRSGVHGCSLSSSELIHERLGLGRFGRGKQVSWADGSEALHLNSHCFTCLPSICGLSSTDPPFPRRAELTRLVKCLFSKRGACQQAPGVAPFPGGSPATSSTFITLDLFYHEGDRDPSLLG